MWALKLLAFGAIAYILVLALIFFAQTALLFPTRMVGASGPLPRGAERLVVEDRGGGRLHGVHIPPDRSGPGERLVILGFGGNAWNADAVAGYLHDLYPQADVVAFHYRGYRPSSGRPTAAALLADAPLLYDHIAERLGTRRIVAVGFSIGTGVAAHLASRRNLAGLILVTPFDSLERIAAERDTLIPPRHPQALGRAVPNPAMERTIPGAGHNDIYQHPLFRRAMLDALEKIEG